MAKSARKQIGVLWAAGVACACLPLAARNLPREQELLVGRQMADEVRRSSRLIESEVFNAYLRQLGSKLAAPRRKDAAPAFSFAIMTGDTNSLHEPLAFGGGSIFVPLNLLLTARDEAEFAGMLAQAMARGPFVAAAAHGTIPVIQGCATEPTVISTAVLVQYRAYELRADKEAARALWRAGYDPTGVARYIERVQRPDYRFSPFPARAMRVAALQRLTRRLPMNGGSQGEEFRHIQDSARAMMPQ